MLNDTNSMRIVSYINYIFYKILPFLHFQLLSLKAEVLKKQEEVIEKKQLPQHKVETFKPKVDKKSEVKQQNKSFRENLKAVDTEELEAHKKSK